MSAQTKRCFCQASATIDAAGGEVATTPRLSHGSGASMLKNNGDAFSSSVDSDVHDEHGKELELKESESMDVTVYRHIRKGGNANGGPHVVYDLTQDLGAR